MTVFGTPAVIRLRIRRRQRAEWWLVDDIGRQRDGESLGAAFEVQRGIARRDQA